jgi:Arc/MetJ-type ribon-helix-helix transcriptional regulator
MTQAEFNLEESEIQFLNRYQEYGFRDRDELIRAALKKLRKELETQNLEESADLYAELYEQDRELQELTESALFDLPK